MRFEPGALVLLLRCEAPYAERFVGTIHELGHAVHDYEESYWSMSPPIIDFDGGQVVWCQMDMVVIGDKPGQDETLTWAPVPKTADCVLTDAEWRRTHEEAYW